MNAASENLVASRTLTDASAWANSAVLDGDLVDAVKREEREVVVMGSLGVVHQLMAQDLVDEVPAHHLPHRRRHRRKRRRRRRTVRPRSWSAWRSRCRGPPCSPRYGRAVS
ncbi:hypothetical protein ACRAWF_27520 [Streptomyces sp. L7]